MLSPVCSWGRFVAADIDTMLAALLDPIGGVERGLLENDAGDKLINIRVDELRRIGECLRAVKEARENGR